ncbi:apolipoprotein A1/A4/E family protein, partial [bacterium]|nr:apolipoprotein A1/A4/E family protein [bacterium]
AITGLGEKVDDLGNKVDDMSRQVGDLSNNVSDLRQGVLGLNEKIDDVADNLSDKIDDLGHGLNDKMDDIAKNLDDKIDDLGKGLGDKVDDLGKKLGNQIGELGTKVDGRFNNVDDALKGLSDKIDDLGKQLSQKNKKFALIGGALVLAAGIIGYFIGKSKEDKVVQPIKNDEQDGNDTIPKNDTIPLDSIRGHFLPAQPIDTTEVVNDTINDTTVDTEAKEEAKDTDKVNKKIKLNENGEYITVWGDSFWNIAERVLEDKYAGQPEKFENLTKSEKEKQIREEMIRIMVLNGYELDENGWFPKPMLYTNKPLQITDTLGNAA